MKRQRLSTTTWVDAGLSALVSTGPSALAAEPLARALGTTKGSFYWHFKDVPDFHGAIIRQWQAGAFADVMHALEGKGSAEQRLRRFGKNLLDRPHDPAMRAWSHTNKDVANAIAQVDAERLKYATSLLHSLGVTNDNFARGCLAALVGLPAVANKAQRVRAFDTMIDLVLALK